MKIVGITGHQRILETAGWDWVWLELSRILKRFHPPLTGVTSLAIGADQLFAEAVLEVGGVINVVVPFAAYADTFDGDDRVKYERLQARSSRTEILDCTVSREECYLAAGKRVVDLSQMIVAVWDGQPAKGLGGTGDIVGYAITQNKPVVQINPIKKIVSDGAGGIANLLIGEE